MLVPERPLVVGQIPAGRHHQTVGVKEPALSAGRGVVHSLAGHGASHQRGNAGGRCAGAEEEQPLFREGDARDAGRRHQAGQGHGRRALDIVVECGQPVAIALQDAKGILGGEVLPLQEHARKDLLHRSHELLDERLVFRPSKPAADQPGVERVVKQRGVLRTGVEHDREAFGGIDASTGGVEGQLADRDPHAVGAKVAETEDALPVRGHDHGNLVRRPVAKHLAHPAAVVSRDVQAAGASVDVTEEPTRLPDRRGVDDRHHRGDVIHHGAVEEGFVAVLERREVDVFLERGLLGLEGRHDPQFLLAGSEDPRGQQAAQAQRLAFGIAEGGALVQAGVLEQVGSAHSTGVGHRGKIADLLLRVARPGGERGPGWARCRLPASRATEFGAHRHDVPDQR